MQNHLQNKVFSKIKHKVAKCAQSNTLISRFYSTNIDELSSHITTQKKEISLFSDFQAFKDNNLSKEKYTFLEMCLFIRLLASHINNKEEITQIQKNILTKLNRLENKYTLVKVFYSFVYHIDNNISWYVNNLDFIKEEKTRQWLKPQSQEDVSSNLNLFMSHGFKRHHNMIYSKLAEYVTILEKYFGYDYVSESENLFGIHDIQMILNYYSCCSDDVIKFTKIKTVTMRYVLNDLIKDQQNTKNFKKLTLDSDKNDLKNHFLQVGRYVKELMIVLRVIHIYDKYISNDPSNIIRIKEKLKQIPTDYKFVTYYDIGDLTNVSLNWRSNLITILNCGDSFLFEMLTSSTEMLEEINTKIIQKTCQTKM